MAVSNDYEKELLLNGEVNLVFGSEIFPSHPLYAGRLTICSTESANEYPKPVYTVDRNGNDIGPSKRPNP